MAIVIDDDDDDHKETQDTQSDKQNQLATVRLSATSANCRRISEDGLSPRAGGHVTSSVAVSSTDTTPWHTPALLTGWLCLTLTLCNSALYGELVNAVACQTLRFMAYCYSSFIYIEYISIWNNKRFSVKQNGLQQLQSMQFWLSGYCVISL